MQADLSKSIEYLWVGFAVVWGIAALSQKRTVRRDSVSTRIIQLALGATAVILIFDGNSRFGLLEWRFIPSGSALSFFGFTLTVLGIVFAVCARFFIGRNWSGMVTVKENHELVRSGPYSLVRHPIYSGILLALLGTAILLGRIRSLLMVGVVALLLLFKLRREELLMSEEFGAEYAQYKQKVKALIPFVW